MEQAMNIIKSIDKRAWETRSLSWLIYDALECPSEFMIKQLADAARLLFDMLTEQETEIGDLKEYMEDNENG
ncbi:hypothetical protein WGC32_13750 [Zongyangia sp. HA2173]|uniref:hypothetical protein n=1 Tax=Zongyangia sp. HA2173 TaxID=3133035 RepID=UPI00316048A4